MKPSAAPASPVEPRPGRDKTRLALLALGVVYGDIGTSPLYALKECFRSDRGLQPDHEAVLGVLSLVVWSLGLIVVLKYLVFVLTADNQGEGGIMALLGLLRSHDRSAGGTPGRPAVGLVVVSLALVGTGLIAADGVITPAISVLGAVEGLAEATPAFHGAIVPIALVILALLFSFQHLGSGSMGRVFGPLMLLWFLTITALAVPWILRRPEVLWAFDPRHALAFLARHGVQSLVVLGSVVLCVTGAEALYADMGHFGRGPIRRAWFAVAFPALVTSYLGQGALLLADGPAAADNPFYAQVPRTLLYPVIGIATCAAVIASQALISGAFSLAMQAMHLGYLPRMTVRHTSARVPGQVYVASVNVLLMLACLGSVLVFKTTSGLAGAYGLAVTGAMVTTSLLMLVVMRRVWHWDWIRTLLLTLVFLALEVPFLVATSSKIFSGGWLPMSIGAGLLVVMTTWWRGRRLVEARLDDERLPMEVFLADVARTRPPRSPGTAVFLSRVPTGVPRTLLHHFKHSHAIHERVVLLTILNREVPYVPEAEQLAVTELGQGFCRIVAVFGFMQRQDVPDLLRRCAATDLSLAASHSYFLGRDTLLPTRRPGLPFWSKRLFAFLDRNARPAYAYFGIPPNRVVELGAQVEI